MRPLQYTLLVMLMLLSCGGASSSGTALGAIDADSILRAKVSAAGYDFIDIKADTIVHYGKEWEPLKLSADGIYTVLHYGDSHIQAGVLPQVVRHGLQSHFGNAGPGMVTPYVLSAAGYEPQWYGVSSVNRWLGSRITVRGAEFGSGVSGVAIRYSNPLNRRQDLRIMTRDKSCSDLWDMAVDNRFSRIVAFHDSLAPQITVMDQNLLLHEVGAGDSPQDSAYLYTTPIYLKHLTHQVDLVSYVDGQYSGSGGGFSGFSLENGKAGVLYHAFGVGGACALHWGRSEGAMAQSRALDGDLIIISLGSNEAAGNNFIEEVFIRQLDMVVDALCKANPRAKVLLVTPTQVFKKSRKGTLPNTNYQKVSSAIHRYAKEKGFSVFDMYGVTGADKGANNWLKHDLIRKDKLHFTQQGYQLQGLLLLNALLKELK